MAVTQNKAVFPQTPKTAGVSWDTGTESTELDPTTVSPTTLLTAGADGSLVTSVVVTAEETVTAEKHVLWCRPGGSGDWFIVTTGVLAAYTQAATDAQGAVTLIDKTAPDGAIRLAANDVLGVTHHVDKQSVVFAEYMDY